MSSEPLYSLRVSEVYHALETSPEGISPSEVESRQSLYGPNLLTVQPRVPDWQKFLSHTIHPMALALWGVGLVIIIAGDAILGMFVWALVIMNAALSYWREHRAEEAIVALTQMLPAYARLIREGQEELIPASEVVPGDILVLAEGDNIPADARVVEEYGLRTNNSTLTGEAVPARKTSDASLSQGISELERPNLVFAGTSVVSGTGRAVIYATGMTTQFGRIARLTQAVSEGPSPLQNEMVRITRIIAIIALGLAGLVYFVGVTEMGLSGLRGFLLALGVVVAAVPEGLPATLTLILAMSGQRLAQSGVLVKKLSILETMGNISIICSDKSGTLTQNQMTVRQIWVARQRLRISGVGYEPAGEFSPDPAGSAYESDLLALLNAASLCNNSRLNPPTPEKPTWSSLGDQTEVALRVAALKKGIEEHDLNLLYPRIHELPFDARRKRMTTIHRHATGDSSGLEIAFVKGAPREILQLCTHILIHGEVCLLDEPTRREIMAANDDYARNALRVLAFARRDLPPRTGSYSVEKVERGLTFLGLMAMMDPPRPEVAEAVGVLRQAGIRLVMITGDYGLTAESLARRVGMLTTANPTILTGAELETMDEAQLQTLLKGEVIFARMAPEHKLRLVSAYQAAGEVVAVTGDGVNDAPALRKADVGVAMGRIGTDVAKEAADIIITNDDFASIVTAIREGRAVYDNLRKFITYIFSSNVPEILPFLLAAVFQNRIFLTLNIRQILAIDLGTDLLPATALGTEKPEPRVMNRPPRPRGQPLVDRPLLMRSFGWLGLIEAALCYAGFFFVTYILANHNIAGIPLLGNLVSLGLLPAELKLSSEQLYLVGSTVYHAGVVTAQIGNAYACRSEKEKGHNIGWTSNPLLLLSILAELLGILTIVYVPRVAGFFLHTALPPVFWVGLLLYAPVLYTLERIRKGLANLWEWARSGRQGDLKL